LEPAIGKGGAEETRDAAVSLAGAVEQRKGALEEGEGGADRWGHGVSGSRKNKRKSGQVGHRGRV
jgi:hypothetical protein